MVITASDVHDGEARREDQYRAEALEIERAKATVAPEIRCDGGEADTYTVHENAELDIAEAELDLGPVDIGDHVEDREDFDATMVVVRTPLEPANEVDARNGKTVAECNPEYPGDDDVVVVKFPKRTSVNLSSLQGYAFPRSRVRITSRVHDHDGEGGDE
ncbi:hypothetical protein [Halostagnicola sp. A-GB9-2]|uniref:hypothetical protein n=1 Tax=Halostagnicola sp. A-GB9-2 TaxID=3048066 RepID=UPI0024C0797C|nr:hypothetical protein [Halostagnicola sp. A-GB9-2]MDJ1433560.1 hypothetical protein [Halostagnicola sp. A-GB9-2]